MNLGAFPPFEQEWTPRYCSFKRQLVSRTQGLLIVRQIPVDDREVTSQQSTHCYYKEKLDIDHSSVFLQILGIIFAICLYRSIGYEKI